MIFEIQPHKGVSIVRGFRDEEDENYIMVMTIFHNGSAALIEGFLSKSSLNALELVALWRFLCSNLKERFIECQVTFEHGRVYKEFLHVVNSFAVRMFNGKERENLTIDMSKGIKHFYFNSVKTTGE